MNRSRFFPLRAHLVALVTLILSLAPACRASSPQSQDVCADAASAKPGLTLEQRRAIFDAAWKTIQEKHFDPHLNGVDWADVRARTAPRVDAARDDQEFLEALEEMIRQLGESHIGIGFPLQDEKSGTHASAESASDGTAGLHAAWIDGKLAVTRVEEGSPAALAHVEPGDEVLGIDGSPTSKLLESLPKVLLGEHWQGVVPYAFDEATGGPVGGSVRLDLASADGARRTVDLVRTAPPIPAFDFGTLGKVAVEFESRTLAGEVLYLRFTPCIVDTEERLERALDEHKNARGVILDLRGNPGGLGAIAIAVARLFVDHPVELGTMHTRENPELRFFVNPDENPYAGPLVVLIDGSTGSTAEILSAGLRSIGRARIVGSRSMGMALPSIAVELPCRWRLQTVIADFQLPNGKSVEGEGVTPDVEVALTPSDLRGRRDPALEAAIAELARAPSLANLTARAEEHIHASSGDAGPVEVSPDAEAVMARLSAALHAERVAAHKSMRVRSRISIMGTEGSIEQTRAAPDKVYSLTHSPLAGEVIQVFDGARGWSSSALQGLRELKGPELFVVKRSAFFDANLAWRELYGKVELLEPREVGGRPAIVVRSTPHAGEGEPLLTFLDPETCLPFRVELTLEMEMGKMHMAIDMSDYKEFDGVPQATRSTTKVNGLDIVTTVDSVEWDVPVDEHLFDKPAKVEKPKTP